MKPIKKITEKYNYGFLSTQICLFEDNTEYRIRWTLVEEINDTRLAITELREIVRDRINPRRIW